MRTVLTRYSDIYLGSFTFDERGGKIAVKTDAGVSGQRLLFFDGSVQSWPMVLKTYEELSCEGLRNISLLVTQDAEDSSMSEGLAIPRGQYEAELQLSPTAGPESWYIMASNCDDVINMDLTITLLNPGGWWTRQFSVDEQGLLPMFAFYIAVYGVGTAAYLYLRRNFLFKRAIPPLEWLFIAGLALGFLSVFLQTTHGVRYAADGVGLVALQAVAEIADAASNCAVMAALFCLAHGLGAARDVQELPRGWILNAGAFAAGFLSLFAFDRLGRTMDQRYCYDSSNRR